MIISNFFEISLIGLIISICVGQLLNFFFPLSDNLLFINIIFVLIYFLYKKINITEIKIDKIIFTIVLLISLINIFGSNFSDDLDHYHYSYILNTDKTNYIWGFNHFHPLYGTSPLWLIGQSYFNFDYSRLQDIHILNGIILFLFLGIFLSQLRLNDKLSNTFKPIFFSLLIFVLFKYTRLKEFGIDRPAYLIFFISIYYYLKYLHLSRHNEINNHFLLFSLITLFIFFIKVVFIFLLVMPLLFFFKNYKKINLLSKKYFILYIFFLSYFIKNILISGCFIYPLTFSCIDYLPWSDINIINQFSNSSEIFNKSFPLYKGIFTANEYIKDFNWVLTWSIRHKIELIELTTTIIMVIIFTFFSFKYKKKSDFKYQDLSNFNRTLLFVLFFSFLFFIFKNPNIRMNHHILIILMILPIINFMKYRDFLVNKKIFISIIFISLFFNFSKNFKRIHEINYKNDLTKNLVHKIYKPTKFYLENFEYYVGWYGNAPLSAIELKNKKFKKLLIFKIIY